MTRIDLPLYQGDSFNGIVTITNADGTPADLTGCTARAQIRRAVADTAPDVAAEIECVITLPDRVFISLTSSQTGALSGQYVWDLQLTTPTPVVTTIAGGKVTVTQEVTRDSAGAFVLGGVRNVRRELIHR